MFLKCVLYILNKLAKDYIKKNDKAKYFKGKDLKNKYGKP